ncbi:GNAT family N-acetyltransferase [Nocardioides sp.]|uniref:GNAT family N-acetyltransferase n=1 Tax=Nocardioides sp. TaxID=35761 RepID=UPI002C692347|nr:GNAT family N-acetyltransferase [Nocardioides sp.]HXH79639.1 GNAT family N-acetyltransferase [Nocardioides sp.]
MIPDDSRFESDPAEVLADDPGLPQGWQVGTIDGADLSDVDRLIELLRAHERAGRGWATGSEDDVLVELQGIEMRENVVLRDEVGVIRAWGSVHDRAEGRMLYVHIVDQTLRDSAARACSDLLFEWASGQAERVGAERGRTVQQIDTGAFADDVRQHEWLEAAGFDKVRTWWQMSRSVTPEESELVPDPASWEEGGVVFRRVERQGDGMPDEVDLRAVHDVLEGAFTDHFNSAEETFHEFIHRLREDPGHRWDHWWLAEVDGVAAGALVGTVSTGTSGPDGSYVAYLGVLASARGRGVAKGLLHTIIADAAACGRDRVGLEVDADSPTRADGLYLAMGWGTKYVTESWHKDVPVPT